MINLKKAVLASDFAFGQFRFLERLLFIHGRYSYYRMSIFLDYFLLKNFAFTFSQFWYGIYCMFSAASVYDDMMIGVFNVVYTAATPIVLALFDKVSLNSAGSLIPNLGNLSYFQFLSRLIRNLGCK